MEKYIWVAGFVLLAIAAMFVRGYREEHPTAGLVMLIVLIAIGFAIFARMRHVKRSGGNSGHKE